jgi:hypothetical protein
MKPRFLPVCVVAIILAVAPASFAQEQTHAQLIEKAARIVKRTTGVTPTLTVKLRTDKAIYRAGDKLQAFVAVPPNSHIRLYYRDAEGQVTVLFPNEFSTDSLVPGAVELMLPRLEDEWDIAIEANPTGTEYLAVVVSDRPFEDATELATAIARDGGQAKLGNLLIEEAVGKGPRAMLVDPVVKETTLPPTAGNLGFAIVQITTTEK